MILIENVAVATVDAADTYFGDGHVVVGDDGRIVSVGPGHAGRFHRSVRRVDGTGCLVTPGLVNTHHHLYQWATRGLALDETLFGWLTTLYPIWARLTPELVHASASANLAWLALTGCTTSTDHHYVFPRGAGDLLEAEILAATEAAITRWHDPSFDAMTRIAVAPCSPFSVTADLMRDSAALARTHGVRLHTHLAETQDEEEFCLDKYGRTSAQYAEELGWLGPDVWMAHCVHLSVDAVARFGATGTGVAHCPTSNGRLGAGIAPVRGLLDAGAPVGLGVDGAASNESGRMVAELQQALLAARYRGGPLALTAGESLQMATMGGAHCIGRQDELGSIEPGKLADVVVWRLDDLAGAGIADPVATLVFGAPRLEHVFVGGRQVVASGQLTTADTAALAAGAARASALIAQG